MIKSLIVLIFISLVGELKSEEITVFDNSYLTLTLTVKNKSSLADPDWLSFKLLNKSTKPLLIDKLDYAIHGFDETPEGDRKFVQEKYGSGDKYKLIHWFHDFSDQARAAENFSIEAGKSIRFWKFPSDKTALAIETNLMRSEEFCALLEVNLVFSSGKISKELKAEHPFCTEWTKYPQLEKSILAERFKQCIEDIHAQDVHSSMIALLPQLKELHPLLDEDIITQGIIKRSSDKFNRERIWLLLVLQEKDKLSNSTLLKHYRQCMFKKNCRWEDDFEVYWNNRILKSFLNNPLYIDKKADILEVHSKSWSDFTEIKDSIFRYFLDGYKLNLDEPITESNFKHWYNTVKYLAVSRHEDLISYFSAMLDDERFFPVLDWSAVDSGRIISLQDRKKAKTVYFRVCDVAYVCLLKILDQIQIENKYDRNRIRASVFIDNKWRGQNTSIEKTVRLKNPYTVLKPNLLMAEKYYYLYAGNKAELIKLIQTR